MTVGGQLDRHVHNEKIATDDGVDERPSDPHERST